MTNWTESEQERRAQVENGLTVVANMHKSKDESLIEWAKAQNCAVHIDRRSKWGNPFILKKDGSIDEVCEKYKKYLNNRPDLLEQIGELKGKVLFCWCYPER